MNTIPVAHLSRWDQKHRSNIFHPPGRRPLAAVKRSLAGSGERNAPGLPGAIGGGVGS